MLSLKRCLGVIETQLATTTELQAIGFAVVRSWLAETSALVGPTGHVLMRSARARELELVLGETAEPGFCWLLTKVRHTSYAEADEFDTADYSSFSLRDWLSHNTVADDCELPAQRLDAGDEARFTSDVVRFLGEWQRLLLLTPGLSSVVRGETWQRVPVDWGGMR